MELGITRLEVFVLDELFEERGGRVGREKEGEGRKEEGGISRRQGKKIQEFKIEGF